MSTENLAIQVKNLTKIYGHELNFGKRKIFSNQTVGIEEVSFSVHKGEIFGFLGPNGAGKTTTIRAILDYLAIQSGEINILGFDHKQARNTIRKKTAYVPGDMSLFDNFTGIELIQYLSHFRPLNNDYFIALKKIFKVNLDKKIKFLSKGNKQQVGLLAALSSKPELLILDEPSSGLDPLVTDSLHRVLLNLRNEGKTIFLSSHDLKEVHDICDRVGIIKNGKMILIESVDQLEKKFLQNVQIEFCQDSIPDESVFTNIKTIIAMKKLSPDNYSLSITGNVNELFKLLVKYEIKRFTCENASLEDIFLQFYK